MIRICSIPFWLVLGVSIRTQAFQALLPLKTIFLTSRSSTAFTTILLSAPTGSDIDNGRGSMTSSCNTSSSSNNNNCYSTSQLTARRQWVSDTWRKALVVVGTTTTVGYTTLGGGGITTGSTVAHASGGATAGKYTTIPIAKRRYYGRVQQAVHEFLDMGTAVVKMEIAAAPVQTFFDPLGVVVVPARRQDIQGQCTKKDRSCQGKEVRDSRYNDMKVSMYLLANAFRTDQQKPPDRLPTVKAARAFFKEMDEMEKLVTAKKNGRAVAERYAAALEILDTYLDLVELPPIDSGHYAQEFDTLVGETARIT